MTLEESWAEAVAHHSAGWMTGALLVEYRCRAKGDLLLHVWRAPRGLEFFAPNRRLSDRFNTAGQFLWLGFNRRNDRETGDRAGTLDDLSNTLQEGGWLWLLCEHVMESVWVEDIRQQAAGAVPGRPASMFLPRATHRRKR